MGPSCPTALASFLGLSDTAHSICILTREFRLLLRYPLGVRSLGAYVEAHKGKPFHCTVPRCHRVPSDKALNLMVSKFKNAVGSASPSSSSSSSGTNQLTITQANTLQALHQEQLARLASITLPRLASHHSQRFLHLARTHTHAADAMWTTQKLQAVQYRNSLWAEDTEPPAALPEDKRSKRVEGRIVPHYYHRHNARCPKCALPLVPGLNQLTVDSKSRIKLPKSQTPSRAKSATQPERARKRIARCTLCHHRTYA